MKRLFLLAVVAAAAGVANACDPDLTVPTAEAPADGGPVTSPTTAPTQQPIPGSDASTTDGGGEDGGTEAGPTGHQIDGTNDFTAGETFQTSSPAYVAYASWDDKNIYFGMAGADIASGSSSKWVLIYVDGNPGNGGTNVGIGYDCGGTCFSQAAKLPFNAGFHIRWKADNSYTNLQKWDGAAWTNVGPITTVARQGQFLELSVSKVALGSPARLKVNAFMLIEQSGVEWTYAGLPQGSFTDGKGANGGSNQSTKYLDFDIGTQAIAPNAYPVKP